MNKKILKKINVIIIISSFFFLIACNGKKIESNDSTDKDSTQVQPVNSNKDSLLVALTKQILNTTKNRDYKKLAGFIHPVFGVRFSPYAYVDTTSNVKFTAEQFIDQIKKSDKVNWGSYDGSGEPILLTIDDYFSKFVYNADFLNAEKTSINKMIGSGNSLNNLEKVYKNCDYTESYFSGFDKKYEGMDWCSIRLVFKKHKNQFYLVGIVHDQWTI